MRSRKLLSLLVVCGLWAPAAVKAQDGSGFVWQSDLGVRQTGAFSSVAPQDMLPKMAAEKPATAKPDPLPDKSVAAQEKPANRAADPEPAKAGKPRAAQPKADGPREPAAAQAEASPRDSKPRLLPGRTGEPAGQRPIATPEPLPEDAAFGACREKPGQSPFCEGGRAPRVKATCGGDCGAAGAACRDGSCGDARLRDPSDACDDTPWRLFHGSRLDAAGVNVRGWIDQGFTWNPDRPGHRFNGPVTFNDRANEYQMNQAYLIAERQTDTGGYGFDVGGRVDLLYGTDSRFLAANGLETEWNDDHRFYGLAMPQLYADFALDDLVLRIGRFYSILGYEVPTAPDNFFYSHSYSHQYGEPFTHTGFSAKFKLNDCWSLSGAIHRGWDQWEDNNDKMGFLWGITWTSPDENTRVSFGLAASNELPTGPSRRAMYSIVVDHKFSDRVRYVFQHDGAHETNAVAGPVLPGDAEWYSVSNYLFYEINPCWSLGLRYEWFGDYDGTRVIGLGAPKGIPLTGVAASWDELALGVNYKPSNNVVVRSELRWDWVDPMVATQGGPFDTFSHNQQFLWGTDLIVRF